MSSSRAVSFWVRKMCSMPSKLSALVFSDQAGDGPGQRKLRISPLIIFNDPEHALPRLLAVDGDGSEKGLNPDAAAAQAREGLSKAWGSILARRWMYLIRGVGSAPGVDHPGLKHRGRGWPGPGHINQLNAAGLMAVAREFPGAGLVVKSPEGARHIPAEPIDALAASMEPFKAAVDAGAPGILVGHMAVPGIDKERPDRPAALSRKLLQLLVRQDWQYQGLLIASDITAIRN